MANINFSCPHCQHSITLPANLAGKQGKCPQCSQVVTIVASAAPPPTQPQQQVAPPAQQLQQPPQQFQQPPQQYQQPPQQFQPPPQQFQPPPQQFQPPPQQFQPPPQYYQQSNMGPSRNRPRRGSKSKVTAGLLALLIGGLGIHKFYLNEPILGVIYILTCWTFIPGIVSFIEGIIYLTMSDEAFAAKYG